MSYVYRYINMNNHKCVYIGKVMGDTDIFSDPLKRRHEQHKRDDWYKEIGDENILLQYMYVPTHADADILETYFISQYEDTKQLKNKAKVGWGKSCVIKEKCFKWNNYLPYTNRETWIEKEFASKARIVCKLLEFNPLEDTKEYVIDEVEKLFSAIKKHNRIEQEFNDTVEIAKGE